MKTMINIEAKLLFMKKNAFGLMKILTEIAVIIYMKKKIFENKLFTCYAVIGQLFVMRM